MLEVPLKGRLVGPEAGIVSRERSTAGLAKYLVKALVHRLPSERWTEPCKGMNRNLETLTRVIWRFQTCKTPAKSQHTPCSPKGALLPQPSTLGYALGEVHS